MYMNEMRTGRGRRRLLRENIRIAKARWPDLSNEQLRALRGLSSALGLSLQKGELVYLDSGWYVSHSGLLAIAHRKRCAGIHVSLDKKMSEASSKRWIFRAVVRKSASESFVGYGDADPSNVSAVVRGAEMRVAETRAVNRALRKAYGIGICSVEELGSLAEPAQSRAYASKFPPQSTNGNSGGAKLRDRLCQIIRQHQLDPNLVKSYAVDFCGTKTLREGTREQVENFVAHLADWAPKDRNGLLCQLNSYLPKQGNAA
jgi:uncharacterized protein YfiM (DUF2279 family)